MAQPCTLKFYIPKVKTFRHASEIKHAKVAGANARKMGELILCDIAYGS